VGDFPAMTFSECDAPLPPVPPIVILPVVSVNVPPLTTKLPLLPAPPLFVPPTAVPPIAGGPHIDRFWIAVPCWNKRYAAAAVREALSLESALG
jgi:hypothetical protein